MQELFLKFFTNFRVFPLVLGVNNLPFYVTPDKNNKIAQIAVTECLK